MKRFIFAWCLLLTAIAVSAFDIEKDGVYYDFTADGTLMVTSGDSNYSGYVHLPDSLFIEGTWMSVTAIADKAFNACTELTGVRMPKHLTTIGAFSFSSCSSLRNIILPNELKTIGQAAFCGCTKLGTINIPATVIAIGDEAFVKCTNLRQILVSSDNTLYTSVEGVLFNKEQTTLFAYPNAKSPAYTVPADVTKIGNWAFTYCTNIETVNFPTTLTTIGDAAFYGCNHLTDLKLPPALADVGLWAFSECESLSTLTLPASLTTIGDGAFSFCSQLQNIYVSGSNSQFTAQDGVLFNKDKTEIIAFPGGKGESYRIPQSVNHIHSQAFYGSNALKSITLNSQLDFSNKNPYVFCDGLEEILVDNASNIYSAEDGVLFDKDKSSIIFYPNAKAGSYRIPDTVFEIHSGTFLRSKALTSISIPHTVNSVSDWAFLGCYALQAVNFLWGIGEQAFIDCDSLQTIVCGGNPLSKMPFSETVCANATLYVPCGRLSEYMADEEWSRFTHIQEYGIAINDVAIEQGAHAEVPIFTVGSPTLSNLHIAASYAEGFVAEVQPSAFTLTLEAATNCPTGVHELAINDIHFNYQLDELTGIALQPTFNIGINVKESTGISHVAAVSPQQPADIFNLQGICVRQQATTTAGLLPGIYIINGQKAVVK